MPAALRTVALTSVLLAVSIGAVSQAKAAAGDTALESRASGTSGALGDADSILTEAYDSGALSADGRYLVFESSATNLDPAATTAGSRIYLRDRQTGITSVISRATGAAGAVSTGVDPTISRNGRFVAFTSSGALVPADTNSHDDVYVRDLQANTTARASVASDGSQGDGNSETAFSQLNITNDGRYVVFFSSATNFGGPGTYPSIYLHDFQTGATSVVSRASGTSGAVANAESDTQSITPDGHFVAFESSGSNLSPGTDTNNTDDAFVRDLVTNTTTRISTNSAGTGTGNSTTSTPSISDDGRYVSFASRSTDLLSTPTSGQHLFVRDVQTGGIVLADRAAGSSGAIGNGNIDQNTPITADGRYVAFQSVATNLTGDATGGVQQIFVRDLQANTTLLASRASGAGAVGNDNAENPSISADGTTIAFDSPATNLVSGDSNSSKDVFSRQLADPIPSVTSVSPSAGLPGTSAGLTGDWFGGATQVLFGTAPASFSVPDQGNITTTAPSGPSGTVDVRVVTPGGTSAAGAADRFTLLSPAPAATPPPPPPPPAPAPAPNAPNNAFTYPHVVVHSDGSLTLTFNFPGAGQLSILGTHTQHGATTATVFPLGPGRHRISFDRGARNSTHAGRVTFRVAPTRAGAALLHRNRHLQILLWAAFQPLGGKPSFQSHYFLIRYHRR
jgi:hypothetical protein